LTGSRGAGEARSRQGHLVTGVPVCRGAARRSNPVSRQHAGPPLPAKPPAGAESDGGARGFTSIQPLLLRHPRPPLPLRLSTSRWTLSTPSLRIRWSFFLWGRVVPSSSPCPSDNYRGPRFVATGETTALVVLHCSEPSRDSLFGLEPAAAPATHPSHSSPCIILHPSAPSSSST